jgi:hypothetical protein
MYPLVTICPHLGDLGTNGWFVVPLDSLDYLLSCGLLGSNILNAVPL